MKQNVSFHETVTLSAYLRKEGCGLTILVDHF